MDEAIYWSVLKKMFHFGTENRKERFSLLQRLRGVNLYVIMYLCRQNNKTPVFPKNHQCAIWFLTMHLRKLHSPIIQMSASFTIFHFFSHTLPAKERTPLRRKCRESERHSKHCCTKTTALNWNIWACFWVCSSTQAPVAQPCELCSCALPDEGKEASRRGYTCLTPPAVPQTGLCHRLVCTCSALLMQPSVSTHSEPFHLVHTNHRDCRAQPGCSVSLGASRWQCYALHLQGWSKFCGLCLEALAVIASGAFWHLS